MSSHILSDAELKVQLDILRGESPRGMAVYDIGMAVRDMVEKKVEKLGLEGVLAESVPWSEQTFPEATIASITTHLQREWKELEASGFRDPSEFADVVLIMAHLAYRKFFRLEDAVRNKFEVNKVRQWGKVDNEGVREHVRHEEEWRGPGHVEHWNGEGDHPAVHFMKLGPDGAPHGIGSTEKTPVFSIPGIPTYRVSIKDGMVVIEKMVFKNVSGGEDSWNEIKSSSVPGEQTIISQLQHLADIGVSLPVQISATIWLNGQLAEPTLNERWESVIEVSKGEKTGRLGKVRRYRKGGKEYAGEVVWEQEVHSIGRD